MADDAAQRDRSLVYLCWLLVVLNLMYFGRMGVDYLFSGEERRRQASFQEALDYIHDNYVDEVTREELWDAAKRGLVNGLNDRWSGYLSPEEARRSREMTDGRFVGIGVSVLGREIMEVFEAGPAADAGLLPGDTIVQVDGRDVTDLPVDELVRRLRGEAGTEVEVGVVRAGVEGVVRVTVTRAMVDIPNVRHEMLEGGIGWLEVAAFDRNVAEEIRDALEEMTDDGLRALVLDMRQNPGGLVESAIAVADLFLPGGLIFKLQSRDPEVLEDPENRPEATDDVALPTDVPMLVLVGPGTASAAEIVAGALQAHGRAELMGATTVGKGSVNEERMLRDGSAVYLTVAHYVLANGRVVEEQGLEPDIAFRWEALEPPADVRSDPQALMTWMREQRAAFDAALRRSAVEHLQGKLQPAEVTP